MAKINLLDPSVFNMISAGEVVERPASVVKELVENSIDAGATQIDITITDGGLKRIQVCDNGIGIEKDDIRNAFLPHATSKLSRIRDLETLSTLGFRGEALPSIASVSEVTLISKTAGQNEASYLYLVGGKVEEERVDSRSNGTTITVENLFYNTPARLKFMKAPSAEQRAIVSTIEIALRASSISVDETKMLPSSLTSILQLHSAQIFWITLPCLPITSPIFSGSIFVVSILGAHFESSALGSAITGSMISSRI